MTDDIFEWEGWEEIDTLIHNYYSVTFLNDFGPWKEGEECERLEVDFENGTMNCKTKSCRMELKCVDPD